jgi:hypothetical protein
LRIPVFSRERGRITMFRTKHELTEGEKKCLEAYNREKSAKPRKNLIRLVRHINMFNPVPDENSWEYIFFDRQLSDEQVDFALKMKLGHQYTIKELAELQKMSVEEAAQKAYVLGCESCVVGRSPDCDVKLRYSPISSEHVKIYKNGTAWFIEDMNSATGTKVNARAVGAGRRRLKDGDIIGLGGVIFVFNEYYKIRK